MHHTASERGKLGVVVAGIELGYHFPKQQNEEGENHGLNHKIEHPVVNLAYMAHGIIEHNHDKHIHDIVANQNGGKQFFRFGEQGIDFFSISRT